MKNQKTVFYLTIVAILSALSFVVMMFQFPIVQLFPSFLQFDLSEVIVLVGGVTLGPLAIVYIELIKNLLNFMFHSTTGGIGELANFVVGVALLVPLVALYKKRSQWQFYILGSMAGIVTMILFACTVNYFITLPLYMGEAWTSLSVKDKITALTTLYVPFNAIKGLLVTGLGYLLITALKPVMPYLKPTK